MGDRVVIRRALIDDEAVGAAQDIPIRVVIVIVASKAPARREREARRESKQRCRQRVNEVLEPRSWRLERVREMSDLRLLWPENGRSRVIGLGFAAGIVGHGGGLECESERGSARTTRGKTAEGGGRRDRRAIG